MARKGGQGPAQGPDGHLLFGFEDVVDGRGQLTPGQGEVERLGAEGVKEQVAQLVQQGEFERVLALGEHPGVVDTGVGSDTELGAADVAHHLDLHGVEVLGVLGDGLDGDVPRLHPGEPAPLLEQRLYLRAEGLVLWGGLELVIVHVISGLSAGPGMPPGDPRSVGQRLRWRAEPRRE